MTTLAARYFDGRTAASRDVAVNLSIPGSLAFEDGAERHRYAIDTLSVSSQLAGQPAIVDLPEGGRLEIHDADAFYAATAESGRPGRDWEHRLESNWSRVLLAVAFTVVVAWLGVSFGIPAIARLAANAAPLEVDRLIGEEGLALLDARLFDASELPDERRRQLRKAFADVVATVGDERPFRLEFRVGNQLGPNAIALPSGIVIITDELVALAGDDEELAAVMAHEVGHARYRHALRALIQNSLVAGTAFLLLGDPGAATTIVAGIPTLVLERSYSREFEREADDVAFEYLRLREIPDQRLTDLLRRIDAAQGDTDGPDWLSTHPRPGDRMRR